MKNLTNNELVDYKFRAEYLGDVVEWMGNFLTAITEKQETMRAAGISVGLPYIPKCKIECDTCGCDVEFSTNDLDLVETTMANEEKDWHVMIESINIASKYTGERRRGHRSSWLVTLNRFDMPSEVVS